MQFGLFCSPKADAPGFGPETGQGFRDFLDFNVEAEALGFHSSFSVEHHFSGWNQASATLTLLTALAMRTTTLRLGSAVIVLPWHNPVLLAEQAATLDLLSGGRLDFGIGKGYRHSEFKGFQIPPEEAEARFEEALEVMTRAFTTRERFSHQGRFCHFDDVVVEPPPAQSPHPPFWVAAGNPHSIARAGERGFNLILDQYASPGRSPSASRSTRRRASGRASPFDPMQVTVARPALCRQRQGRQGSGARAPGRLYQAHDRVCASPRRQGAARTCLPMPTGPAPPKNMRCSARPTRSARHAGGVARGPACAICC